VARANGQTFSSLLGAQSLRVATIARELLLIARIALFALSVPTLVRLRLDRLGSLLELASAPSPTSQSSPPTPEQVRQQAALVDRVLARTPFVRSSCLVRGLTRYYALRTLGAELSLCFGVRVDGEAVDGHCWLEMAGAPYLEPSDPRPVFTEMYRLPARR
jgi:hypothetical protein